jgi:hypothetical protein
LPEDEVSAVVLPISAGTLSQQFKNKLVRLRTEEHMLLLQAAEPHYEYIYRKTMRENDTTAKEREKKIHKQKNGGIASQLKHSVSLSSKLCEVS